MIKRAFIFFLLFYIPTTIKAQGALNGLDTYYFLLGLSVVVILLNTIFLLIYLIRPKSKLKTVLFVSGIIFLFVALLLISVKHGIFRIEGIAFLIFGGLNLLASIFRTPQIR
jgi:hypothetical protein